MPTSGYPTLSNLSDFAGTIGDYNGDGIDDSLQPNVLTVSDRNGLPVTVTLPSNSTCSLDNGSWIDANSLKADTGFTPLKDTMTQFNIYCPTPGMTVPVTLIFDKVYNENGAVVRYFNTTSHAYSTIPGSTFTTKTINGTPETVATYSLTDGGPYDGDGAANEIIQDPVGIAIDPNAVVSNNSSGNTLTDTGLNLAVTIGFAVLLSTGAIATRFAPSKRTKI
jgi:hypothetical protein